jgi:hypothetical protein
VSNGTGTVATPVDAVAQDMGYQQPTWDLTDSAGNALPEGVYDVTITAIDDAARSATASFKLGIWRHGTGAVATSPANPVSGNLTASFTPSLPEDSTIQSVYFDGETADQQQSLYLPGTSTAPWTSTTSTTPTWSSSYFYGGAADGDYNVTAEVDWTDPLGGYHYTTSAGTAVTISNDVSRSSSTTTARRPGSPRTRTARCRTGPGTRPRPNRPR